MLMDPHLSLQHSFFQITTSLLAVFWIVGSRVNLFCGIWKIVTPNCLKNLSNYFSVKKCFKIDSNFQVFKPIMTEELYRYQHKKVFQLFFTALAKARFESVRVNK